MVDLLLVIALEVLVEEEVLVMEEEVVEGEDLLHEKMQTVPEVAVVVVVLMEEEEEEHLHLVMMLFQLQSFHLHSVLALDPGKFRDLRKRKLAITSWVRNSAHRSSFTLFLLSRSYTTCNMTVVVTKMMLKLIILSGELHYDDINRTLCESETSYVYIE